MVLWDVTSYILIYTTIQCHLSKHSVHQLQENSKCLTKKHSDWLRAGQSGDQIRVGFRTCPDRPLGPPSHLYNGCRVFPGGKEWPGHDNDPSPPSSAMVKKG
jgi:hypothetical protein